MGSFAVLTPERAERIRDKRELLRTSVRSEHFRFLLLLGGIAYVATFVVYNYFFTHVGFTNHTFPNVWVYDYPSFKTEYEGRWFADILIQLTGGSGVPTLLIALAAGLQIVNAFVFAAIWRVHNRATLVVLVLLFCFHPALLDYYSFSIDHVSFVAGDSLAVAGVFALDRFRRRWYGIPLAALAFVLSMATYQPKIALIALLLVLWCLRPGDDSEVQAVSALARRVAVAIGTFVASVVVYYVSVLILTVRSGGERRNLNPVSRMIEAFGDSYRETVANFTTRVDYLPRLLLFLPALLLVAAVVVLLVQARRRGLAGVLFLVPLIACVPPALQLSYIVNDATWEAAGRILSPHLYLVGFAVVVLMGAGAPGRIAGGTGFTVLIYFFVIVASQETNSAALREAYDTGKVQRIVARIEQTVPDGLATPRSVVVIGELPFQSSEGTFKRFPNRLYSPHVTSEPFVGYRQTQILNFYLGRYAIEAPTEAQTASALTAAASHHAWPAPDAVFLSDDGTIVVLLQPYRDGLPVTRKRQ